MKNIWRGCGWLACTLYILHKKKCFLHSVGVVLSGHIFEVIKCNVCCVSKTFIRCCRNLDYAAQLLCRLGVAFADGGTHSLVRGCWRLLTLLFQFLVFALYRFVRVYGADLVSVYCVWLLNFFVGLIV